MSWYDNIRRFVPFKGFKMLDNTPVQASYDVVGMGHGRKMYYPEDTDYVKLTENNFVLSDVIGKIAKTFANAKFTDENKNSKLLQKIQQPNAKQSQEEFLKEFCIYLFSSGFTMVWKKYKSYGNFDTLELININPDPCVTDVRKTTIVTEIDDKAETIPFIDLIFFYDIKKNHDDNKGYSRIKPLRSQVRNIEDAQRAKNIQIRNSGITIVSPKANPSAQSIDEGLEKPITMPVAPNGVRPRTQKDDMEDKLNTRDIENRIIVSSRGVDATNLSAQLSNMDFYKMVEPDILAVYDAFGFPPELSPYGKNATFENKPAAENMLIENEILPLAESFTRSLNQEFPDKGAIEVSYDHLSSVAQTKNTVHETNSRIAQTYRELATSGVITTQEAKQILKEKGVLP